MGTETIAINNIWMVHPFLVIKVPDAAVATHADQDFGPAR